MAEEDCEIEYLDEDEEIIQQFVHSAPVIESKTCSDVRPVTAEYLKKTDSFLVEKRPRQPKRKLEEDDSDYDPSEDIQEADSDYDPDEDLGRKKRKISKTYNAQILNKPASFLLVPPDKTPKKIDTKKLYIQERKKKGIRIPDYDDPLCLPVKAICKTGQDVQKLKSWNKHCLEHYKNNLEPFRPFKDPVVSSSRTTIFRKGRNKTTGQVYTTVWNKIYGEDVNGKQKSEVHQNTLPLFREKIIPKQFVIAKTMPRNFIHKREILLTKEKNNNEDCLVAYNPGENITAVYKEVKESDSELAETEKKSSLLVMKEATCNQICAPCYQVSWRGVRKRDNTSLLCSICSRTFVSVYNLLSHLKTHHNSEEIQRHKAAISRALASVVDYHYKCRICQESFLSIKLLRKHVVKHQGTEIFHCDIGNHVAK